jgi:hypothetical protein
VLLIILLIIHAEVEKSMVRGFTRVINDHV